MIRSLAIVLGLSLLFAAGCSSTAKEDQKKGDSMKNSGLSGDTVTTPSGLKYLDLKIGTGAQPMVGQTCEVHYTGWLMDGKKFDSSKDRGQPFPFPLGQGRVIKGWDEGVATMKVGGARKLIVPPSLGYGERGFPGAIPPNSTLVFEVELLAVR